MWSVSSKMSKKDSKEGKEGEMKALYRELNTLKQNEEYEKAIKVRLWLNKIRTKKFRIFTV